MSEHDDDPQRGVHVDRHLIRRLIGFLRPQMRLLVLGVLLLIGGKTCDYFAPVVMQRTIDGPLHAALTDATLARAPLVDAIVRFAAIYFALALAGAAIQYVQMTTLTLLGQRTTFSVRQTLFGHLLRLPLSWFDKKPVGELLTRTTGDVENLVELFTSGAVTLLLDPLWLLAILVTLFVLDWRLAAITLLAMPLYGVAAFKFRERARAAYRETRRAIAQTNAFLQESIAGVRTVQLGVQEERTVGRLRVVAERLYAAWLATVRQFALFVSGVDFLGTGVRAVTIVVGAGFVLRGSLTPGHFWRYLVCLSYLFEPLRELAERWNVLQSALVATERIAKILDEPPEQDGALEHAHRGRVEFDRVSFHYDGGPDVLQDVSFSVKPGETVAFVGATGAGKTTVTQLLLRLYRHQTGTIAVDGADVATLELKALRAGVGVVPQDVFLFADTILENVRLFDAAISEEQVRRACETVGAHEFIARLPLAYATQLGERGMNLSAGERQLLAFARVLVRDPRVLILDEATSSVDTHSERLLQRAVEKLLKGRTCLVIAHRLSTIRRADQILVFHHARLRERGTHAELLRQGGIYARLHELQFAPDDRSPEPSIPVDGVAPPADVAANPPVEPDAASIDPIAGST